MHVKKSYFPVIIMYLFKHYFSIMNPEKYPFLSQHKASSQGNM